MNDKQKLEKLKAEHRNIGFKIDELKAHRADVKQQIHALTAKLSGLVKGETVVREINGGIDPRPGRAGHFMGYYDRFGSSTDWIKVRLLKKDGSPGKRVVTFYNWQKEPAK